MSKHGMKHFHENTVTSRSLWLFYSGVFGWALSSYSWHMKLERRMTDEWTDERNETSEWKRGIQREREGRNRDTRRGKGSMKWWSGLGYAERRDTESEWLVQLVLLQMALRHWQCRVSFPAKVPLLLAVLSSTVVRVCFGYLFLRLGLFVFSFGKLYVLMMGMKWPQASETSHILL